jgi:hypothetical protein
MPSTYCSKQESLLLTSRCSLVFRIRRLLQESSSATSVSLPAFGENSTVTEHRAGHFATHTSARVSRRFCQKTRLSGKTLFSIAPRVMAHQIWSLRAEGNRNERHVQGSASLSTGRTLCFRAGDFEPLAGQVRLRVDACDVCHSDLATVQRDCGTGGMGPMGDRA